jgi:hypothetical protein
MATEVVLNSTTMRSRLGYEKKRFNSDCHQFHQYQQGIACMYVFTTIIEECLLPEASFVNFSEKN